jgi:ribosome-binding protein aMBF1 (putative translation factor)
MTTIINGIKYYDFNDLKKEIKLTDEEKAVIEFKIKILGAFIEAREKKGITQKELERQSGIKQSCIARMERCHTLPQITTILKLLHPLGLTLSVVPESK